jgi:hypothetical protein
VGVLRPIFVGEVLMAVDLSDILPRLQSEVNPPGVDLFPDATDAVWLLHLQNGFWEAVLDGIITGYTINDDGVVTPTSGSTDLSDQLIQLVIFYAGMKVIRNYMLNLRTKFRAAAGSTEYEYQQSASTMKEILADLRNRRNLLLERLSDLGTTSTYVVDAVIARDIAITDGGGAGWVSPGDSRAWR